MSGRRAWIAGALVACLWTATPAAAGRLHLGGYVAPAFTLTARPAAQPVDRLEVGMGSASAGLIFVGEPTDHWRFEVDLRIGADVIRALVAVDVVDLDNDGEPDAVLGQTAEAIANIVEETTVTWRPVEQLDLRAGKMRIPYTSQSQAHDMALMFPQRAGPAELFLRGTDLGVLVEWDLGRGIFGGSVGVFNGTGLLAGQGSDKGILITARMDLTPLGPFAFDESDLFRDPFRLGVGIGLVYNPYTSYDSAGEPDVRFRDTRASASLRMAVRGLSFVAEGLLRYQTDSLTSRPLLAAGAYGQLGVFTPVGLEPAVRVGWVGEDQSFDPRHTLWLEGGLNLYPAHRDEQPDVVKITVAYQGEDRITEKEWAHGAIVGARLKW